MREKEFLGVWGDKYYGRLKYPEATIGEKAGIKVICKNSVVPISPDGNIYRCHSDLYAKRSAKALGNILQEGFDFADKFRECCDYGLCNECDVKIKNNHNQEMGYTSVEIKFVQVEEQE
jgi:radical SAM protein with 4Fe4S-binding SPASM domain